MSYRYEKNLNNEPDLVIDGWENGIAPSPHKGLANIQNGNIYTETGEVMCSFNRILQSQVAGTGTLTQVNTNTVSISGITLLPGTWITILVDSGTGLSGDYYVSTVSGVYHLSNAFVYDNTAFVTGITTGSATFRVQVPGKPLFRSTEIYYDANKAVQYRYYILDDLAQIWVHDTAPMTGIDTPTWFSIYPKFSLSGRGVNGLAVFNGWVALFLGIGIYWCPTCDFRKGLNATSGSPDIFPGHTLTDVIHNTLVGHQGKLYWTDGNYIGSLFPNSSLKSGGANVQSYCSWITQPSSTTYGRISDLIGGSYPYIDGVVRIPAMFFASSGGALPTSMSANTLYYIQATYTVGTGVWLFQLFTAETGGSAIADISTGASGTLYFNTFNPVIGATDAAGCYVFTSQRLNLPFYETAQCLAELGNTVVIGGSGNILYPWDQISPLPADIIPLPENDTKNMITVNNMLYVFAGHKGNIYVTNGSSASLSISVPDYCAGVPGTPASYIEPYFSWGDAMYCRGRVYFSILDQTATKAGNCGGIWSFTPTQNFYIGQDVGQALRLENQNSYGTYNGCATVLINSLVQTAIAPQYWSGWESQYNGGTYGIDFTDTVPCTTTILESDLIPTGTDLQKKTFLQVEYKLAAPFTATETISISYRLNGTDAWTSCGTAITESTTGLSGYFPITFQNTQWLQLRVILNSIGNSTSSFCRLREIRVR